jgi:hypothetical protein
LPDQELYFAYSALLAPDRIAEAAPGAEFRFIAHYPETQLAFVSSGNGSVPTLISEEGHTVWGAVFSIPSDEVEGLVRAEKEEGREPGWQNRAIDREGNKYACLTFVAADGSQREEPSVDYVNEIIRGARHWKLPAGWVVGLEDLTVDSIFD